MSRPAENTGVMNEVPPILAAYIDEMPDAILPNMAALADADAHSHATTRLTDCAVFALDRRGRITACNIEGELFSTDRPDELLGRHVLSLFVRDRANRSLLREALKTVVARRRVQGEANMLRRESEPFVAHVSVDSMVGADGAVIGFVLIACDKSQRRQAEERLRESERRFRLFADGIADSAICLIDPSGLIVDWTPGAQRMTGFHSESVCGHSCHILFDQGARARGLLPRLLARSSEAGRIEVECMLMRSDGRDFPAELVIDPFHHCDGSLLGFALILRDITARRTLEQRLREAHEKIHHGQKIEAVGQLASGIAHDFNNSLQGIVSSLEMASFHMERGAPQRAQPCVETALDAAVRAGGLTQRLLGLVRRPTSAGHGALVDQVLLSMRELLPRVLGDGIQLDVAADQDMPPIPCDGGQLEPALLNLAINARDAMGGHGRLVISSGVRTREQVAELGVTPGRNTDAYIEITVRDDGPGMSEEVRAHALEPFFTTKPKGQGTGLGLAMVHDLVTQYGGAIDIQSGLGCGTAVRLYLPCGVATEEDDTEGQVIPEPDLSGFRIMVVENDDIIRRTIAARLRQLDCVVYESSSGRDALLTLSTCHALDLLLSDIDLPGLDGYELSREARLVFPSLPIILMTGYADAELLGHKCLDKATESLLKPFDMGALLAKIHLLLLTES